jgi:hypothetical protein
MHLPWRLERAVAVTLGVEGTGKRTVSFSGFVSSLSFLACVRYRKAGQTHQAATQHAEHRAPRSSSRP